MNPIIEALILGIIQGITEWLPVSSSAHLTLAKELFNFNPSIVYDVFLHLASIIVILIYFWNDIKKIVIGFFELEKKYVCYVLCLILATIPIGVIGLLFGDVIKGTFQNIKFIGVFLIVTAVLLFLSKYPKKKKNELTYKNTFFMGLIQALALFPGISRLGSTTSIGFLQGVKREEVVKFSLFMLVPAILGATILEFHNVFRVENYLSLSIAMLTTIIVGLFSISVLFRIVKKNKLHYFSLYCLALGLAVFFI